MKISELPSQLCNLALRRQEEAGNIRCVDTEIIAKKKDGGFDWHETPEGVSFWTKIHQGDYTTYFKRYDIDMLVDETVREVQIILSEHSEDELRRALKKVLTDNLIP